MPSFMRPSKSARPGAGPPAAEHTSYNWLVWVAAALWLITWL